MNSNQIIDSRGNVTQRPDWADDPNLRLTKKHAASFASTEMVVDEREEIEGKNITATVVFKDNNDIVYQLFPSYRKDFRSILAEAVEAHFGSTDSFKVHEVSELKSWALLAEGVQGRPFYNKDFYVDEFVTLLDTVLEEVRSSK